MYRPRTDFAGGRPDVADAPAAAWAGKAADYLEFRFFAAPGGRKSLM
jgi:hypothetical protein